MKYFDPEHPVYGRVLDRPELLDVSEPVPVSHGPGFHLLIKRPDTAWQHTRLFLDGRPLSNAGMAAATAVICRSLVGGWHVAGNSARPKWPYRLVVNETGHIDGLQQSLTLNPVTGNAEPMLICGPALLVKQRLVRRPLMWTPRSMDWSNDDDRNNVIQHARRTMIINVVEGEIADGLFRVDLTTPDWT